MELCSTKLSLQKIMGKRLTTHKEIKQYVISVIKAGDSKRIQKVLKYYWEWLDKKKDIVQQVFGDLIK